MFEGCGICQQCMRARMFFSSRRKEPKAARGPQWRCGPRTPVHVLVWPAWSLRGATSTAGLAARATRHPMIAPQRLGYQSVWVSAGVGASMLGRNPAPNAPHSYVGANCVRPPRCSSLVAVFLCKVVLSLSRESTKERPGATMEVWPPDPSAHSCLACVEPSRGDLHSRVGGAGSAPPHDRSPAFGISRRLGKRRRWGIDVGS